MKIPDDPVTVIRENSRKKAIVENTAVTRIRNNHGYEGKSDPKKTDPGGTKDEKARELL